MKTDMGVGVKNPEHMDQTFKWKDLRYPSLP